MSSINFCIPTPRPALDGTYYQRHADRDTTTTTPPVYPFKVERVIWKTIQGLKICNEWRVSFYQFLKDMGSCPEGHTIDRVNSQGPFAKWNCRWAPKRSPEVKPLVTSPYITYRGETLTASEWGQKLGMRPSTIVNRINYGWSLKQSLNPLASDHRRKLITWDGETMKLSEWARKLDIEYIVLSARLRNGWTVDRAFATTLKPTNI